MRRIQILAMAAAITTLIAFAAVPAFAVDGVFGDGIGVSDDSELCFLFGINCGLVFGEPFEVGSAAPASQEFSERRITSGAANPVTTITNSGDNSNLCPTTQQIVNTGNVANEQGVVLSPGTTAPQLALPSGFFVGADGLVHDDNDVVVGTVDDFLVDGFLVPTTTGDIDFEGSSINVDGSVTGDCTQTIEQASAVGG